MCGSLDCECDVGLLFLVGTEFSLVGKGSDSRISQKRRPKDFGFSLVLVRFERLAVDNLL